MAKAKRRRVAEATIQATSDSPGVAVASSGVGASKSLSGIDWWGQGQGGSASSVADRGTLMLANLLRMPAAEFHEQYFLQKPLHRRRVADKEILPPGHWVRMLPLAEVWALLRRRHSRFLHDVDVTRYVDGRRTALSDGDGPIDHGAVKAAFTHDGYSIRLVMPQQWHQACFELCSCLQEHFGFTVGCSAYLTPPSTQGFPPHYDDVEVFVLQLEGTKSWRLYERPDALTNPAADCTTEFTAADLGEPMDLITLHAGDVLYLPRGVVHQALAQEEQHSLHLTFSTYQKHTWRDVLDDSSGRLSARASGALAALRQPVRVGEDGPDAAVLRGMGLLRSLPLDWWRTPSAGEPAAGWTRCGAHLVPPHAPFWLTQELWADGTLGRVLDAHALRFLSNSLPPLDDGTRSPAAAARLEDSTCVRPRAPHCARLVDEAHTSGHLSAWEAGEVPTPSLILYTNVLNARALSEPQGPAFEVLPSLARSVLQVLAAGAGGIRVGELKAAHAHTSAAAPADELQRTRESEERADLFDLLEVLLEHGVLVAISSQLA